MQMPFFSLYLTSLILIAGATASAANFSVPEECLTKLSEGQNRSRQKLPLTALKQIAMGLKNQGNLQEDPVALLVDYSVNSKEKRSFMIDFKACEIVQTDYVIHGGHYRIGKEIFKDGDSDHDGMLDTCKNKNGSRSNMTRPGLYRTAGCHKTYQEGWTALQSGVKDCEGVKLIGLEKRNDDAMSAAVVLHEHVLVRNNGSIKPVGQGCPTYPKGKLKDLLRYGLLNDTLVYVHAPQCK